MGLRGPKTRQIDYALVEDLAAIDCNDTELMAVLHMPMSTYTKRKREDPLFCEAINRGRAIGNEKIRRKMFDLAMEGNVTMLIWLSKNRLGYTDKSTQEISATGTGLKVTVSADDLSDDELAQIIYNSNPKNKQ